jgi:hypothetical protein
VFDENSVGGLIELHAWAVCGVAAVSIGLLAVRHRLKRPPLWPLAVGLLVITALIVAHAAVLNLRQILEVWAAGSPIDRLRPLPAGSAMFASAIRWGLFAGAAQVAVAGLLWRDLAQTEEVTDGPVD